MSALAMNSRNLSRPPLLVRGFSLLEIMVALALGLLLSVGIMSLFSGTSRTNKLQNGLAQLQENGRFATTRIQNDLRRSSGQYCSNFSGKSASGTVVPLLALRAPQVYAAKLGFSDPSPPQTGSISVMNSVDGSGYATDAAASGNSYPLSPRFFMQGYSCDTSSDCTSGLPGDLPTQGLAVGNRLPASDVLTVRYQRGSGWPVQSSTCATGAALTLARQTGDDAYNFKSAAGVFDSPLAIVTDCQNVSVLPVASVAGNVLTLGTVLGTASACPNPGLRDMRAFNFSKDFVTVTYYVGVAADASAPTRMIPVLIRRENGVDQELVQGVDQLRFSYGVQDSAGKTQYLTAAQVTSGTALCPQPPAGIASEPGCLWRAIRTIEAHMLVNTVNDVGGGLDASSLQYKFMGATTTATTPATVLPSGLKAGSMLRREFIAFASNRNYNF